MSAVEKPVQREDIALNLLSIHRIREALHTINSVSEKLPCYEGMKIRQEIRFINGLLTELIQIGRGC